MAPEGSGIYQALVCYKAAADRPQRAWRRAVLAAMLRRFLGIHGRCLNRAGWDVTCTVPSLRGRAGHHPLALVVAQACRQGSPGTGALPPLVDVVRPGPAAGAALAGMARADAFCVDRRAVEGRRVLLVDDVCTSGAHAQSARAALVLSGATRVDTVVVGRRIQRGWPDNQAILEWASCAEHRWDPWRCARCAPDVTAPDVTGST